jgi:hypothetical protein
MDLRAHNTMASAASPIMHGKMLSKNRNHMKSLPGGCIFDGEIVALDDQGRPRFNWLMFRRRAPVYVAFDVLFSEGKDLRGNAAPVAQGHPQAPAPRPGRSRRDGWRRRRGSRLFDKVCELDLEGIVAKRMPDPYARPTRSGSRCSTGRIRRRWGGAELFDRR